MPRSDSYPQLPRGASRRQEVQAKHLGGNVGEILQARDLVVCDSCRQAGGECSVDLGAEAGLDVSVLQLGWGSYGPNH